VILESHTRLLEMWEVCDSDALGSKDGTSTLARMDVTENVFSLTLDPNSNNNPKVLKPFRKTK